MRKLPLLLLMINMFTLLLGVGIVIPILPAYLAYFEASGMVAGLLIAAFGLTQLLFSPIGGSWSDRFGRKPLIIGGMVLNAIAHLIFAMADHLSLLFISRLIGGIGLGLTIPSITAYVVDVTDREDRVKGMGWIGGAISLGIAIGPGIGGFLAGFSMRAPYYGAAALTVLAIIFSSIMLAETRKTKDAPSRLEQRPRTVSISSFTNNVQKQLQSGIFIFLLLAFLFSFGLMSFETAFPLLADAHFGYSTNEIAMIFTAGAIMGVIVQFLLLSMLTKRFGEKRIVYWSLSTAAVTLVLMLLNSNLVYILLLTAIFFTTQSLLRPIISAILSKRASENEQGYVAGLGNTYMSLGNIFGPVTAGLLYDLNYSLPYMSGALIFIGGFLLYVIVEHKGKKKIQLGANARHSEL